MSTIYIVTTGDYSDKALVCSAFSTRELADAYVDQFNKKELGAKTRYRIEELELDGEKRVHPGLKPFTVEITTEGDILHVHWSSDEIEPDEEGAHRAAISGYAGQWTPNQWVVSCWARDEEHAKKIATEMRQEAIAADAIHGGTP